MNAVNPGDPNAPRFNAGSGFTLLPIISSPHFPIISDAWAATYYVDATNGNDANTGLSEVTPWKTIAKVNTSNFNPGAQILFKGPSPTLLRMDPNDQLQNMNVGPAAFVKNKDPKGFSGIEYDKQADLIK